MAEKIIVWNIKIGGMWVEVCEKTFINTIRILCDYVAIFYDKNGYPVGEMYFREV